MTAAQIINAAPMTLMRGTQDLSTRKLLREPDAIPTHLPLVCVYAQKGPTESQLVVGESRSAMFGSDSFDPRKKWFNHATAFSNAFNAEGNAQMIKRVIPTDAGTEANFLLSLDVLETNLPVYDRNADGSIKVDIDGDPIQLGISTTPGYKCKWVVTNLVKTNQAQFGVQNVTPGDQTDVGNGTQSSRYPILEFKASSIGEYGNDSGIRLWAPTTQSSASLDKRLLSKAGVYPFRVAVIHRNGATGSASIVENNFGEQSSLVTFMPGTIDPSTDKQLYVDTVLLDQYRNLQDVRYPYEFGDFGALKTYQNNIDTLLDMFYTAEKAYMTIAGGPSALTSDFGGLTATKYLFNMVGGTTSEGKPYSTFQFATGGNAVRPTEYLNIFAAGSSDGTINDAAFAALVAQEMDAYADVNSSIQDTAVHVESIFYDSGFPLETKYALCNFIATRKDTAVVLTTYSVGEAPLDASEENSLAIALRTRLQFFPESDYFGTPVMRGLIMGRSGKLRNSQVTQEMPYSLEIAIKSARYMGAGNGIWKNGYNFDGAPGSIIENFSSINVNFTPASVRNKDWDAGLNWAQSFDRRSLFIPALKTVYTDDTSVLNSYFTMMIICEINKVCERAWRQFSGVSNLTNAQLAERVNEFITKNTQGRFDGRVIIEPNTFFTDADIARGYSWTTAVKVFAPNMKTVMTTYVQAYRLSDYTAA